MTKINYTTSKECRTDPVPNPGDAVQVELQGCPANVAALASLLRQQTQVLEESCDVQEVWVCEVRRLVVKERISK